MNLKQKKVIEYINKSTRGIVKISERQAAEIIDICCVNIGARAELFQFSHYNSSYIFIRTVWFKEEMIDRLIQYAIASEPIEQFYKYVVYDSSDNFCTNIFSLNSTLLD